MTRLAFVLAILLACAIYAGRAALQAFSGSPLVLILVAVLAVAPALAWLSGGLRSLPLLPVFCAVAAIYYVGPVFDPSHGLSTSAPEELDRALAAVACYLAAAQLPFWISIFRRREQNAPLWTLKRIPLLQSTRLLWGLIWLWVLFGVLSYLQILSVLGAYGHSVTTIIDSLGLLAIFMLGNLLGRGQLGLRGKLAMFASISLWAALKLLSGFLDATSLVLLVALMGYVCGARRIPVVTMLMLAMIVQFLHLGKDDFRDRYWIPGANWSAEPVPVIQGYRYWADASWRKITTYDSDTASAQRNLLQRLQLLGWLSMVVRDTPEPHEYLNGETYAQLPLLLVPRFLYPGKPRGTLPSETLAMHYGVQTAIDVEKTSVGFGQIAEGWANFGWMGVIGAGITAGWLLFFFERLSQDRGVDTVGYIICVCLLPLSLDLEHCLAQWIVIGVQTLTVILPFLWIVMRVSSRELDMVGGSTLSRG